MSSGSATAPQRDRTEQPPQHEMNQLRTAYKHAYKATDGYAQLALRGMVRVLSPETRKNRATTPPRGITCCDETGGVVPFFQQSHSHSNEM